MKAKELKIGDYFSLSDRKNAKVFCVRGQTHSTVQKEPTPHWVIDCGPEVNHGKLLIIVNDCRQMTFTPDEEVIDRNQAEYEVNGQKYVYDKRVVDAEERFYGI